MVTVFFPSVSQMNYSQADRTCEGRVGSPVQTEATEMPVLLAGLLCHPRRVCGFNGSPAPLVLNLSLLQMSGQRIREQLGTPGTEKFTSALPLQCPIKADTKGSHIPIPWA